MHTKLTILFLILTPLLWVLTLIAWKSDEIKIWVFFVHLILAVCASVGLVWASLPEIMTAQKWLSITHLAMASFTLGSTLWAVLERRNSGAWVSGTITAFLALLLVYPIK
jgi:peptidoglycan/LPS O-acetylase OafA/YrhL